LSLSERATAIKPAATLILIRPVEGAGCEVFLACRHHRQSFMAGAFVFPGGRVEVSDSDPELSRHISTADNFNPQALLQDSSLTFEEARGYFICAIRETFEETGILLAVDSDGNYLALDNEKDIQRFDAYRHELLSGEITFSEIARRENIFLFLDGLLPYSYWITPEIESKRFATYFFLAKVPPRQLAVTDKNELTNSLWVSPKAALQKHFSKEIMLMPPTLKTLEELAVFSSTDQLFAAAQKRIIYPILPQVMNYSLLLPHDPEYSIQSYRQPPRPDEHSRFIYENDRWKCVFPSE